jgi:hypothetical protein
MRVNTNSMKLRETTPGGVRVFAVVLLVLWLCPASWLSCYCLAIEQRDAAARRAALSLGYTLVNSGGAAALDRGAQEHMAPPLDGTDAAGGLRRKASDVHPDVPARSGCWLTIEPWYFHGSVTRQQARIALDPWSSSLAPQLSEHQSRMKSRHRMLVRNFGPTFTLRTSVLPLLQAWIC